MYDPTMDFSRKELQKLRQKALERAEIYPTTTSWKRAYWNLADAANVLDALLARSPVGEVPKEKSRKVMEHISYDGLHSNSNLFHDKICEIVNWINRDGSN